MTVQNFMDSIGVKIHYENIRQATNEVGQVECYIGAFTVKKGCPEGQEYNKSCQIYAHGNNKKVALHNFTYQLKTKFASVRVHYTKKEQKVTGVKVKYFPIPEGLTSGLEGEEIKVDGLTVKFN